MAIRLNNKERIAIVFWTLLAITILLSFVGCAKPGDEVSETFIKDVDPRLQPYVDKFVNDLSITDFYEMDVIIHLADEGILNHPREIEHKNKIEELGISYNGDDGLLGRSYGSVDLGKPDIEIVIDGVNWLYMSEGAKNWLVMHELGHAYFTLYHDHDQTERTLMGAYIDLDETMEDFNNVWINFINNN